MAIGGMNSDGSSGGVAAPPPGSPPAAGQGGAGAAGSGSGGGSGSFAPPSVGPGSSATHGQFTGMYQVTRQTADRVEFGPPVDVPPGAIVSVSPISTNTVTAFVSVNAGFEAAKGGPRIGFSTTANPRTVKVRNLREIGVYSTAVGEGVTIDIQEGS